MVITARQNPTASHAAAATHHAAPHATAAHAVASHGPKGHGHRATSVAAAEVTPRQIMMLVVQGSLVGIAILVVLGIAYFFFGDVLHTRLAPVPVATTGTGTAPAGPGPTLYYRDRGDGTVSVMEIDEKGMRMRGTMNRADVPLLQEKRQMRRWEENFHSPDSRINALGSAFR